MQQRIDPSRIEHAQHALQANIPTLALLPMDPLFKPIGYLNAWPSDG